MKKKLVNNTMKIIKKYYSFPKEKLEEIKYGIESLYLTIFKTILFFLISLLLKDTKELILFILTYGLLRISGFGLHAKKSIHCWIFSSVFFIGFPLLIKYMYVNKYIIISLCIPLIVLLMIYAPADTEKRPIININKRRKYKIITSIVSIIYLIIIIYSNNNTTINLLFLALLLETLLVLPISYKLLNLSYSNYKKYN